MEQADEIIGQMIFAYNQAEVFLCPEPSMNMPAITQVKSIGPIARVGHNRKTEICQALGIAEDSYLVLHTLGGEQNHSLLDAWPQQENVHFLVQDRFTIEREDVHNLEQLEWDFADLIASSDVFITKPGYGTFAESACNGARVIYVRRPDWPEEPYLVEWLKQHALCEEISREQHASGMFHEVIKSLLQRERQMPREPAGIINAVEVLESYLSSS
jgi:UDP-N-acetylglucosamine:LPS N-acetylglucosamine transferase